MLDLPYFDDLFEAFRYGDLKCEGMWGANVHFGYWQNPTMATGSLADIIAAGKRMNEFHYRRLYLKPGARILDVGCGFGGAISQINDHFTGLDLVGLNIDSRQIKRAEKRVQGNKGNKVSFVEGNACQMPFADRSFDHLIAIECAFHFESRLEFFKEAKRILRPGGKCVVSDFILPKLGRPIAHKFLNQAWWFRRWGVFHPTSLNDYRDMIRTSGFSSVHYEDITNETIPHYDVMTNLMTQEKLYPVTRKESLWASIVLNVQKKMHLLKYFLFESTMGL